MAFTRLAIANRGEAAMRLIRAVREVNASGGEPIRTVALHTEGESRAMFVREADLAYNLGPASARPYLDLAALERALVETGADAVWPGWGFVAEDPAFVDLCDRLGVTFVGPSAEAMRRLGDKIGSKLIAEEVGVPVAPWSRGAVDTLDDALAAAERIGYPLMLKATAGGGGRGIRKVSSAGELADAYQRTSDEALRAFGNGTVFLERLVTGARHVEVQLIADAHGTAWAVGVRDCTVQRRNQKVIEESASPLLGPEQVAELKASAERLALAVGYVGAGTVEFLYHPGEKAFAFLEVNTRLQVEHSITEAVTGLDLVKLQLHVAAGGRLTDVVPGGRPAENGHAVEARLNAEDPDRDFAPAPGRIVRLDLPSGPGVRVDTGVAEGDTIPPDFDSMIAKIIAWGPTRADALARLRRAMTETTVVIEGGACNKTFVLDLLRQPEVTGAEGATGDGDGWADTGWIDRVREQGRLVAREHAGIALVAAAVEAYTDELQLEIVRFLQTAHGGRPQAQHGLGRPVELKLRGTTYQVSTVNDGPGRYRVTVASGEESRTVEAELERIDDVHRRLVVGGRRYRVVTATYGPGTLVEVDGVAHRVTRDEGGVLRSPAPALVVATPVPVGAEVEAGAPVLVLESMKMETVLHAPFKARVKELLVVTGSQVGTGAALVRLEPVGDGGGAGQLEPGPGEQDGGRLVAGEEEGEDLVADLPGRHRLAGLLVADREEHRHHVAGVAVRPAVGDDALDDGVEPGDVAAHPAAQRGRQREREQPERAQRAREEPQQVALRLGDLAGVVRHVGAEDGAADDVQRQVRHLLGEVEPVPVGPRVRALAGRPDGVRRVAGDPARVEGGLDEPALAAVQVALAGEQAVAEDVPQHLHAAALLGARGPGEQLAGDRGLADQRHPDRAGPADQDAVVLRDERGHPVRHRVQVQHHAPQRLRRCRLRARHDRLTSRAPGSCPPGRPSRPACRRRRRSGRAPDRARPAPTGCAGCRAATRRRARAGATTSRGRGWPSSGRA